MLYLLGCSTYEYPETVRKISSSVSASILPVEREIPSGGQLMAKHGKELIKDKNYKKENMF